MGPHHVDVFDVPNQDASWVSPASVRGDAAVFEATTWIEKVLSRLLGLNQKLVKVLNRRDRVLPLFAQFLAASCQRVKFVVLTRSVFFFFAKNPRVKGLWIPAASPWLATCTMIHMLPLCASTNLKEVEVVCEREKVCCCAALAGTLRWNSRSMRSSL